MMRAQNEYTKRKQEVGPWDYVANKEGLEAFGKKLELLDTIKNLKPFTDKEKGIEQRREERQRN